MIKNKDTVIEEIKLGASLNDYPEFKNNKEIALIAISTNIYNFYDLPNELLEDKDIIFTALKKDGQILATLDYEYRDNEEAVKLAYYSNNQSLRYASDSLRSNKALMLEFIRHDIYNFQWIKSSLRDDKDILYLVKSLISNPKDPKYSPIFEQSYLTLLQYEREDSLNQHLISTEISHTLKNKKKI